MKPRKWHDFSGYSGADALASLKIEIAKAVVDELNVVYKGKINQTRAAAKLRVRRQALGHVISFQMDKVGMAFLLDIASKLNIRYTFRRE
ncbi:hypothetical protein [Antrihabitans sp. YC2-6]|uniref:hypothetical protein n=1 Tax=Antrihabitans sp. YC2-6 TaxID=2799498 RepID=UPI0018F75C0B|nr:hypothetical protein [Antrihabitans sp. YC2-6]MBJ8348581.1 hypothetical protein [Antrihabitans sp. YC2-6]